jgi:alpha-L-fucosidase
VGLYKKAGARYFVALANHHDNFDLYDSKYQPGWNATRIGPKKDLIAGWSKAARAHGLRFGVSVHASHAWNWYDTARGADKSGPLAGVPYDGLAAKGDGKGKWWEGLDPQALYAQHHVPSQGGDAARIHKQWDWGQGASIPDKAYCEKFYDRTAQLLDTYEPRPWAVFGEGPAMASAAPISAQGFNEGKSKPFTSSDIRFTAKGDAVYAFVMGWPVDGKVSIKSTGGTSVHWTKRVSSVELAGSGTRLAFSQTSDGLQVTLPSVPPALPYAFALTIA